MSDKYWKSIDKYEDLDSHVQVVSSLSKDSSSIKTAIDIVKDYHDTPRFLYEGVYNRHLVRVARILLEEFRIHDTNTILTALCHDLGEWSDYDLSQLKTVFNDSVHRNVRHLTWDKKESWEDYVAKLKSCGSGVLAVKLSDKLDNNRAAIFSKRGEEIVKALQKTNEVIYPILEKHFPEYESIFAESVEDLEGALIK